MSLCLGITLSLLLPDSLPVAARSHIAPEQRPPAAGSERHGLQITPGGVDVAVQIIAPRAIVLGEKIEYQVIVTNLGQDLATNLLITATLPAASAGSPLPVSLTNYRVTFEPPRPNAGDPVAAATSCFYEGNLFRCQVTDLSPGGVMLLALEITPHSEGLWINQVSVSAAEPDLIPANNSDSATTFVGSAFVELNLTKTVTPTEVMVGQPLTYTLHVTNQGNNAGYGVTLIDPLPPGFVLDSFLSPVPCDATDTVIDCSLGTLLPQDSHTITLVARPTSPLAAAAIITNTAQVTLAVGSDAVPQNNTASVPLRVTPRAGDLALTKQASAAAVIIGQPFTYTFAVTNLGDNTVTGVQLIDHLPAGLVLAAAEAGPGVCSGLAPVTCRLTTLAAGNVWPVALQVVPTLVGTLTNSAVVTAAYLDDTVPGNSSSEALTIVSGLPTVINPHLGATITYTNAQGSPTEIIIPPHAIEQPIRLVFSPQATATPWQPGFALAGHAFALEAYTDPGGQLLPGYTFSQPFTITLTYSNANLRYVAAEDELMLYYWNGSDWVDAATTCSPVSNYQRSLAANRLAVAVCHLTNFALFGPSNIPPSYLPLIFKGSS